jgi:hypothetical protein
MAIFCESQKANGLPLANYFRKQTHYFSGTKNYTNLHNNWTKSHCAIWKKITRLKNDFFKKNRRLIFVIAVPEQVNA